MEERGYIKEGEGSGLVILRKRCWGGWSFEGNFRGYIFLDIMILNNLKRYDFICYKFLFKIEILD